MSTFAAEGNCNYYEITDTLILLTLIFELSACALVRVAEWWEIGPSTKREHLLFLCVCRHGVQEHTALFLGGPMACQGFKATKSHLWQCWLCYLPGVSMNELEILVSKLSTFSKWVKGLACPEGLVHGPHWVVIYIFVFQMGNEGGRGQDSTSRLSRGFATLNLADPHTRTHQVSPFYFLDALN